MYWKSSFQKLSDLLVALTAKVAIAGLLYAEVLDPGTASWSVLLGKNLQVSSKYVAIGGRN